MFRKNILYCSPKKKKSKCLKTSLINHLKVLWFFLYLNRSKLDNVFLAHFLMIHDSSKVNVSVL